MSSEQPPYLITPADYDRAADRVLAIVIAARETGTAFPAQVRSGLAAVLSLLDGDADLTSVVLVEPTQHLQLEDCRWRWALAFGNLLREAAARTPDLQLPPPFLEPHLIAGIGWRLRRERASPGKAMSDLLPSLLDFVLRYYLDPSEVPATLSACGAGSNPSPARRDQPREPA
jgi:hypothetical protein